MEEKKASKVESKSYQVAVVTWLTVLSAVAVVKIVVGSVSLNDGCHGICLLPYYLLVTGVLALAPAAIAVTVTCSQQHTRLMEEMWSCAGKFLFLAVLLGISGTFYILTTTVRVSTLDRLCKQTWVPIFGVVTLLVDWILFILFLRLFGPGSQENAEPDQRGDGTHPFRHANESSPFHIWKLRNTRRTL